MKKTISTFTFLLAALFVHPSFATSLHPGTYVKKSELTSFKIDEKLSISSREVAYGSVTVNQTKNSLQLLLGFKGPQCPKGRFCALPAMPAPFIVNLPLVDVSANGCHSTVYTAYRNAMPVDGAEETLTVIDNSTNTCKYFAAIPPVEVIYEADYFSRKDGRLVKTSSTFTGKPLSFLRPLN